MATPELGVGVGDRGSGSAPKASPRTPLQMSVAECKGVQKELCLQLSKPFREVRRPVCVEILKSAHVSMPFVKEKADTCPMSIT